MGAVLRVVTMRRLWYAQIVSTFGDFLALFAVITYMTFRLHATPQQVTGIQIAYLLPIALISVISGVFVDRWPVENHPRLQRLPPRRPLPVSLLVHTVYGFYAVLAAISVISSFFGPAQGVAIRSAVPFHGLRSANALMQQVMFIMRIIGPSIAILLVGAFGAKICYWLDSASFIASGSLIASLSLIVPRNAPPSSSRRTARSQGKDRHPAHPRRHERRRWLHRSSRRPALRHRRPGCRHVCDGLLWSADRRLRSRRPARTDQDVQHRQRHDRVRPVRWRQRPQCLREKDEQHPAGLPRLRRHRPWNPSARSDPHGRDHHPWLLPHRLLRRRHHRSVSDAGAAGDATGTHGPRRFHPDVGHLHRADPRPGALRHPRAAHQYPRRLRTLHRASRRARSIAGKLWMEPAEHPALT